MYVSRMILWVMFGVLMLPPLLAPLAMRLSHGWLMLAGLWIILTISCFWIAWIEQRADG